jgi:hypothetical protein
MATSLVTPVQISSVTIGGAPGCIVLGDDDSLYFIQLVESTNKQLSTIYYRLPPIYKDGDYQPITDGSDPLKNVADLLYTAVQS